MKIGIDSYCYHRFFGEVYPQQKKPRKKLTLEGFLDRAHELKVDGVSLESCFIRPDAGYLREEVRGRLDAYKLDRVWAWGHPDGLEGGKNAGAYDEMIANFEFAAAIGAPVMRVVGSSLMFRFEDHGQQIRRLVKMFRKAVKVAADYGVRMAVENHIDFTSDEVVQLLDEVDSDWLGLNFDTANFARLLDDPIKAMRKLAPRVLATHVKDLRIHPSASVDDWYFFSCTPVGDGFVNNRKLAEILSEAGYRGFLAAEIDMLHPDYKDEDEAVAQSVKHLRTIARGL